MSQTPAEPQVVGKILMYQRPELLSKEAHGALGISRAARPFGFCARLRAVPITVGEVTLAMKHFPIIFSTRENPVLLAVLGIIDEINLFVDEAGEWDQATYIPAYIRRYPFAVAAENGSDRFAVVIDAAHEGIVPGAEFPFFNAGAPSPNTEQAIEFCKQFENERVGTEQAMKTLAGFDLLSGQSAQFTPPGRTEQQTFAEYFGVDAAKLQQFPDDRFLELRRTGILPLLYAQLHSFSNWRDLMNRRAKRFNLTEETLLRPAVLN